MNCKGVMEAGRRASAGAPFGCVFTHFKGAFAVAIERREERTRSGQRSCMVVGCRRLRAAATTNSVLAILPISGKGFSGNGGHNIG
jgi:hypothetical protein